MEKPKKKISRVVTGKLLMAVIAAFSISFVLTFLILYHTANNKAYELVKQNAFDVTLDIFAKTREYYYQYSNVLSDYKQYGVDGIREKMKENEIEFSYLTDLNGIIIASGVDEYMGRDMHDIPEIKELLDEFEGFDPEEELYSIANMTEKPVTALDGKTIVYYCIMTLPDQSGFAFVSVTTEEFYTIMLSQGQFVASNRHIGKDGFNVLVDEKKRVLTTPAEDAEFLAEIPNPELIDEFSSEDSELVAHETVSGIQNIGISNWDMDYIDGRADFWGKEYYYFLTPVNDVFYVYSLYPVKEALSSVYTTLLFMLILEVVIFTVLFFAVRLLISHLVVKKLDAVNSSLAEITNGNLEEKVEVRDTVEFNALSDDINETVDKLKDYIAEAAARIDADLAVAKAIQSSALPGIFPPYPDHKEFELFASMNAAKEVGGDFYDFYMLNDHTLGFLIADVSGKSIPGAMFMMTAKTVIKSLAESGLPPAEVFTLANEKLCEGNKAEMFVTAWMGFLDLETGLLRAVNAGHNPPVLISGGQAEYVKLKSGLVLAGMEGMRYKENDLQLKKGDILFLYTDGVTEAMDVSKKLYGEERLLSLLSFGEDAPEPSEANGIAEPVCRRVTADIESYTEGAEQSDDITMLCIRYLGKE